MTWGDDLNGAIYHYKENKQMVLTMTANTPEDVQTEVVKYIRDRAEKIKSQHALVSKKIDHAMIDARVNVLLSVAEDIERTVITSKANEE